MDATAVMLMSRQAKVFNWVFWKFYNYVLYIHNYIELTTTLPLN